MATATLERKPKRNPRRARVDFGTLADLMDRLGNVPPKRIRMHPTPGCATEKDVILARQSPEHRRCELIDGVLVEKMMGTKEALLAGLIVHYLWDFLERCDLGIALGADGYVRLFPGRIRIPDVSFFSWNTLPGGELPDEAIASIVPDLAIEVRSKSNTRQEIDLKLADYFGAGVKLVWVIDPATETAEIYTAPDKGRVVKKNAVLIAEDLLPGFRLPLKKLFAPRKKPKS